MGFVSTSFDLASEFARVAGPVDPTRRSNTKWRPIDALLAEELGIGIDDVYTATLSKAGNLSVRLVQSRRADAGGVAVGMWTGRTEADFDRTVAAARTHLSDRDLVILAGRERVGSGGPEWTVRVFLPGPNGVPPSLAQAWPNATVIPL